MSRAYRARPRVTDVKPLEVGDWVFIYRNVVGFRGWTGPGVLLAESPTGNSLWVTMRGRLFKVSREQVRNATAEEHLGAELIQELSKDMLEDLKVGKNHSFTDVEPEGPPEEEDMPAILPEDEAGPTETPGTCDYRSSRPRCGNEHAR